MPNILAYGMFLVWPLAVFLLLKKYPVKQAILYSVVLSSLMLPVMTVDPPLLPPLNKRSITSLALLLGLFLLGKRFRLFEPGVATKLVFFYCLGVFITAELNGEAVLSGGMLLPGLSHYDALTSVFKTLLFLVPFLLGRYYFKDISDNKVVFKFLVITALFYSVFMLFEVRMSPQLHYWIYGFSPTSFIQQIRGDGFRPFVFIGHGLPLAFWFSTCVMAAAALHKNKVRCSVLSPIAVVCYMLVVLLLCKTISALLYASFALFLIYYVSPKRQLKWVFLLSLTVLLYPLSNILGLFPTTELINFIEILSPERAQSLEFRFKNEDALLSRAMERPFFGWGDWGRNRVYSEFGKDTSVTDGKWILELGTHGFIGFFMYYSLLITPLYYANKAVHSIQEKNQQYYFATLAIILVISLIDSVPNTNMGAIQFLLAGALLGQSERLLKSKVSQDNTNKGKVV